MCGLENVRGVGLYFVLSEGRNRRDKCSKPTALDVCRSSIYLDLYTEGDQELFREGCCLFHSLTASVRSACTARSSPDRAQAQSHHLPLYPSLTTHPVVSRHILQNLVRTWSLVKRLMVLTEATRFMVDLGG